MEDQSTQGLYSHRKREGLTYDQRLNADLGHRTWDGALKVAPGRDYWYVPGELLLSAAAEDHFRGLLERFGMPDRENNDVLAKAGIDVRRWTTDRPDVPRIVAQLRRLSDDDPSLKVAPNHVLRGAPAWWGGPAHEPRPIDELELAVSPPQGRTAQLAVLDTGVWDRWHTQPALAGVVMAALPADLDVLDLDGDRILDTEAGHGTFICGLVERVASGLRVDPRRVLDPTGLGSDFSIALGLLKTDAPVINLSLGGYTDDDLAPLALEAVLERLGPDRVVVAAAGNHGSDRPFWPAAFKHVVSVGALDTRVLGVRTRADFSSYGSWLDVWVPGYDLQSLYVEGHWATSTEKAEFRGWASWSGTSFSAPVFAAEVALRSMSGTARGAVHDLLGALPYVPGIGVVYEPAIHPVRHYTPLH